MGEADSEIQIVKSYVHVTTNAVTFIPSLDAAPVVREKEELDVMCVMLDCARHFAACAHV